MRVLGNSQIWIVILILITVSFFSFPAHAKYGGGTGEPNDPYLIYIAEHLNTIGAEPNDWDKHFKLMADIDLSGITYSEAVITSFGGMFDGNGLRISNITITGESYLGLFSQLSCAEVRDLGIVDVNIIGSGKYIGGLAGYNSDSIITSCFSTGEVNGWIDVGGLIGENQYGEVTNCYSTAVVNGQSDIGGFVGNNEYGLLANCYSAGKVSGDSFVGGFLGRNGFNVSTVNSCFWDKETSGLTSSDGGTGKTTVEMQTAGTFDWDFVDDTANRTEDIWWIDEGQDYPRLWWELNEDDNGNSTLFVENDLTSIELASDDDTSDVTECFTEQFSSSSDVFDLSYKSIMFTPTTDGSFYSPVLREITQLPTEPAGGTYLDIGDDGYILVNLTDQKRVSIYGFSYIRFYVGSNGYITFTRGDTYNFDTLVNHFNTKRISCLFEDLDPSRDGIMSSKQLSDRIAVTWEGVPEYGTNNPNTFQIEMYFDGRIQLSWLEIASEDGIVGLSQGLGLPEDFQEIDFSELSASGQGTAPVGFPGRRNRKK